MYSLRRSATFMSVIRRRSDKVINLKPYKALNRWEFWRSPEMIPSHFIGFVRRFMAVCWDSWMKKFLLVWIGMALLGLSVRLSGVTVSVTTPMVPPEWALLERELLRAQTELCQIYFDKYFDERGYLECVERWGGDNGPDDAIECVADWPILHALGADDSILTLYKRAWEGHLRQYTEARTTHVPFAREGMFYKEFHVMFDWMHLGEELRVFNLQGLSDPYDIED